MECGSWGWRSEAERTAVLGLAFWLGAIFFMVAVRPAKANDDPLRERGEVHFVPTTKEGQVAERFRLAEHTFAWEAQRLRTVTETLEVWDITFPSPVITPHELNNTVHGEYYRPRRPGPGELDLARRTGRPEVEPADDCAPQSGMICQ